MAPVRQQLYNDEQKHKHYTHFASIVFVWVHFVASIKGVLDRCIVTEGQPVGLYIWENGADVRG